MNPKIFKSYDIRGVYPEELDPDAAYRIGWGFAQYLRKDLKHKNKPQVAVGMDMRGSSPFLARELISGLNSNGVDVVEIGRVSTPALYYSVAFKNLAGGVMVTASHNPKEFNGMKFCREKAMPVGDGSGLELVKKHTESSDQPEVPAADRGTLSSLENMNAEYTSHDLSFVNLAKIKKIKIVADPGNAMGALYLDELFSRIECDLVRINWQLNGNMPVHEPNPLKEETLQQIKEVIRNEKADFGIAVDGDGDRIAFLDENGEVIPSFVVLGLVAKLLLKKYPESKIAYDLRMSKIVKEMIEESGGKAIETRVGHSHIKALMSKENVLFSGELSMHYYFRENFNFESPVFATAQMLLLRSLLDRPFSQIWKPYYKYHHSGEQNFEVDDKEEVIKKLEEKYKDGQISHLDGVKISYPEWWFSVRASNTESLLRLNLEAETEDMMKQKLEEVTKIIKV